MLDADSHAALIRSVVDDSLVSFRQSVREDINNLHLDILRQFHSHHMEFSGIMHAFSQKFERAIEEVKTLKNEYNDLRHLY